MTPGIYDIPTMVRGDTFAARTLATATEDGAPLVITRALLQVRTRTCKTLVQEWSTAAATASITGTNAVLINSVAPAITEEWATGNHLYELEVDTATYGTITLLAGSFRVLADITRD